MESLLANETKRRSRHFFRRDRRRPDERFVELSLSSRSIKGIWRIETSIVERNLPKSN